MQTYLVRLRCLSPYLTPWRNCTLWGRLSWIVADGRLPGWTIEDWIEVTRNGQPPVVVGDGFPTNAVPVPALFLATATGTEKRPKTLTWDDWTVLSTFRRWPERREHAGAIARVERMHVVLSRDTGTALLLEDPDKPEKRRGQLRTEIGEQPSELIILAQVDDILGPEGLETLMRELCKDGWGQGRTYGYGNVELISVEATERPAPTGWVATLGHCHPTEDLPREGYWRWTGVPVRPHDVASRRGATESFTTMLLPGASFASDDPTAGRSVGIDDRKDYLHVGLAPTWPIAGRSA